jgi:DNA repair photolyase
MVIKCIKDTIKNINIVIGCSIGCAYCYARINNNRFHTIDDFNNPEFFENKLKILDNKRHKAYLLTGQSDLSGWNNDWLEKVFEKINNNIDTQYLFLTKRPENINLKETPDNGWFGVTVTSSKESFLRLISGFFV